MIYLLASPFGVHKFDFILRRPRLIVVVSHQREALLTAETESPFSTTDHQKRNNYEYNVANTIRRDTRTPICFLVCPTSVHRHKCHKSSTRKH